jgi:hypothetical protein
MKLFVAPCAGPARTIVAAIAAATAVNDWTILRLFIPSLFSLLIALR